MDIGIIDKLEMNSQDTSSIGKTEGGIKEIRKNIWDFCINIWMLLMNRNRNDISKDRNENKWSKCIRKIWCYMQWIPYDK